MTADFRPELALAALLRHEVEFVLIGGLAARLLGSATATRDTDVCHRRTGDNLERLAAALTELHATPRGVDDDVPFRLDARTLKARASFTFSTDAGALGVLARPAGANGYDQLHAMATPYELAGGLVWVVHLDDLIQMKRAAARPKDLRVVEELLALRDQLTGQL